MTDPRIAQALAEIRRAPEHAWTLAELASGAAMSRTAFAERFRALVGTTPVNYLTAWLIGMPPGAYARQHAKR